MILLASFIAGFGPLGTPELIVISVLLLILVAPILAVFGVIYYLSKRNSDSKPKVQAINPTDPTKE